MFYLFPFEGKPHMLTCTGVRGQQLQCQNSLPNHADKPNISCDHRDPQLPPQVLLRVTQLVLVKR